MIRIVFKTLVFSMATVAWTSFSSAQAIDLQAARETVLDLSSDQLSALESVLDRVPARPQGRITEAIKANETSRNQALGALGRAQREDISREEGLARAFDAVKMGTRKHTEVLTDLLGKVPEEARPGSERALQVSQRGRNTALSTLGDIKHGRIPAESVKSGALGIGKGPPSNLPKPIPGPIGKPDFPGKIGGPFGGRGPFGAGGIPGRVRPGR